MGHALKFCSKTAPDNEVGWAMEERWKNRVGWTRTRSRGVCSAALMPVTSVTQVSNRESTGRLPCTTAARVTTCTARSAPAGTSPVRRMKQSAFGATASWKESVKKASEASFPGASMPHLNAKTLNVRFSRPSRAIVGDCHLTKLKWNGRNVRILAGRAMYRQRPLCLQTCR